MDQAVKLSVFPSVGPRPASVCVRRIRHTSHPLRRTLVSTHSSASRSAGEDSNSNKEPHQNGKQTFSAESSAADSSTSSAPPKIEKATYETELRRETFAGRVAILTLGAMLLGERVTGRGIVQTLNHNTGIPLWEMEPLLAIGVFFLFLVALYPSHTPLLQPTTTGKGIFLGVQRLLGRLACLLLAGTIITEIVTGKGALSLFNIETGKEALDEAEIFAAFLALLLLTASPPDSDDPSM